MLKRNFNLALILLLGFSIAFVACKKKKKNDTEEPTSLQSENDNAAMDGENANIIAFVSTNGDTSTNLRGNSMLTCATISIDILDTTDGWPRKLTIDFGPVNNNGCGDGRYRRGKIYAVFTAPWWQHLPQDSATITTENYYVNDVKHEGTRYIIIQDSITINVQAVNCKATWTDNTFATWDCNRTRKFIAGWNTPYVYLDDVFEHAGIANGTNRKGETFSLATQNGSPLVQKLNCQWLVSGRLDFTPQGKPTRTVDWGNGTCDDQATVTVNGITFNITLP